MKHVPIAEFKANCSRYVEELEDEEIVVTKHGKPVARVTSAREPAVPDFWELYESRKGQYEVLGDVFSTGAWDAES